VTTTIFGWDASHYDGDLTKADLVQAKAEGIAFITHKIGEGTSNTDETAAAALTAARDAGIKVIGGYYFIHSGGMVAQAVRCIELADRMVPWWRTFPGWFWQTDAETDTGGHLPSPAEVKEFSDALAAKSGRRVVVYASHGMYGNRLAGLGHLLWNANYPSSRKAGFKDLYPGNSYAGWTAYSGQTPALCQYTSSATIAGHTTCDANAFRGTVDELLALVAPTTDSPGGSDVSGFDAGDAHFLLTYKGLPATTPTQSLGTAVLSAQNNSAAAVAQLAALQKSLDALSAAIAAGHGTPGTDTAAVLAAVKAVGDAESATHTELLAKVAELHAQNADLLGRLAAAEQAAAAVLAK
jgi:GH25 family lysozyme M1 (1,4-beta-N-acetylmuramidase)